MTLQVIFSDPFDISASTVIFLLFNKHIELGLIACRIHKLLVDSRNSEY
jgi:hypothetical protein